MDVTKMWIPREFSTDGAVSGEPSSLGLSRVVTEEDEVNAMEPGTVLPIHRHRGSTETVVVLRGKLRQKFYDENGQLTESFEVAAGSNSTSSPQAVGFSVELGRWHNTDCLESGTVKLECMEGKPFDELRNNEALGEEDIMKLWTIPWGGKYERYGGAYWRKTEK